MACQQRKGERVDKYEEAFKRADANNDGYLNVTEFCSMLRGVGCRLSDTKVAEVFLYFMDDPCGDKKITLHQFQDGLKRLKDLFKQLEQLFCQLDADKSGYLDRNELRTLMEMANMNLSESELTEILKQADKNKDNKISYEEFLDAVC